MMQPACLYICCLQSGCKEAELLFTTSKKVSSSSLWAALLPPRRRRPPPLPVHRCCLLRLAIRQTRRRRCLLAAPRLHYSSSPRCVRAHHPKTIWEFPPGACVTLVVLRTAGAPESSRSMTLPPRCCALTWPAAVSSLRSFGPGLKLSMDPNCRWRPDSIRAVIGRHCFSAPSSLPVPCAARRGGQGCVDSDLTPQILVGGTSVREVNERDEGARGGRTGGTSAPRARAASPPTA